MFSSIEPTDAERVQPRPGDDIVSSPDAVMDRAFTVPGAPADVWPWIQQLGKNRAGWYLSRRIERLVPRRRRAVRTIDPRWQSLKVGDDVPDYGGADEIFTVARIEPPHTLVYTSQRRSMRVSWSVVLQSADAAEPGSTTSGHREERDVAVRPGDPAAGPHTRVQLRLRMAPIKRVWLAKTLGEAIDVLTIAAMVNGLRERLVDATDRIR